MTLKVNLINKNVGFTSSHVTENGSNKTEERVPVQDYPKDSVELSLAKKDRKNLYWTIGGAAVFVLTAIAGTIAFMKRKPSQVVHDVADAAGRAGHQAPHTKPNEVPVESPVLKPEKPNEVSIDSLTLKPEKPNAEVLGEELATGKPKEELIQEISEPLNTHIAYVGKNGVKSPIPKEQILELPNNLETDVEKLLKSGKIENMTFADVVSVKNIDGLYDRLYILKKVDDKYMIDSVMDTAIGEDFAFRRIKYNELGEPRSIFDLTTPLTRVNHLETPSMKAAREAREAARKAAQEAYDAQMKEKLIPQARGLVKDMEGAWTEEVARATRIYEQAEQKGFESLKGVKVETENNVPRIRFEVPGSNVRYDYISQDGKKLNAIYVYKDGVKSHEIDFIRSHESGRPVEIAVYDGDVSAYSLVFKMDRKSPEFKEYWKGMSSRKEEDLLHIFKNQDGKFEVAYNGNKEKDVSPNSFWTEL